MLISDLIKVRAQLQAIIRRLAPTPAAPGTQSHTAATANPASQLMVSPSPDSAKHHPISLDLNQETAVRMHTPSGTHDRCGSDLPADKIDGSGAPAGAVRIAKQGAQDAARLEAKTIRVEQVMRPIAMSQEQLGNTACAEWQPRRLRLELRGPSTHNPAWV